MSQLSNWSLIGVPDHLGVIHVGGRIGAAHGPSAFRRAFGRLRGRDPVHQTMLDCGDLSPVSQDIQQNLLAAAELVNNAQKANGLTVVVGGGHDHGYAQLLGVSLALGKGARLGCINIDADLDVRKPAPAITSGSAFHLAIEGGVVAAKNFIEFGTQSHCNAPELWDFVERHKIKVVPFENLRHGKAIVNFKSVLKKLAASCDAVVISLDLDSVASAFAPGVSSPKSEGFTSTDILEMMEASGEERKVASLGIFELNPMHDRDDMTARLAATAGFHFISRALRR